MNRYIFLFLVLLALLSAAGNARAELRVQADRQELALDETLNLSITKEGGGSIDDVVLQPLSNDFKVLGRSQSSNTQFINGSLSSSFSLSLELAPKRTGVLIIPALVVGKDSSQPLTIRVVSQAQPKTRGDNGPVFVESEVEPAALLVQEQAIYTLRVYMSVDAQIVEPGPPPAGDVLWEKLADATYIKVLNGRNYRVFERKYAFFPQKSGVLEIPPLPVQLVVAGRQRSDPFAGFFGQTGENVRLHTKAERIVVKEKPPEYPAGTAWLPTAKLTVSGEWSREVNNLPVGEPVNLTISLSAPGLLGAQLPPLVLPQIEGVKIYQDKAQVENLKQDGGITGVRKESIALIPTRPGGIQVPEVRIPWWDKGRRQVAYAVLPARRLLVTGSALANGSGGGGGVVSATNPNSPVVPELPVPAPGPTPAGVTGGSGLTVTILVVVGMLFLGGWLFTVYLLLQARRQLAAREEGVRQGEVARVLRERQAFALLAKACHANDPQQARSALLAWVKGAFPEAEVATGADLTRLFGGSGLAADLAALDRNLYGRDAAPWSGAELLAAVEGIRKVGKAGRDKTSPLPPLYQF